MQNLCRTTLVVSVTNKSGCGMCKQRTRTLLKTLGLAMCIIWLLAVGVAFGALCSVHLSWTRRHGRVVVQYMHALVRIYTCALYMACHCTSFACMSTLIDRSGPAFMSAARGRWRRFLWNRDWSFHSDASGRCSRTKRQKCDYITISQSLVLKKFIIISH